jgi:hypothetical protein
LNLCVEDCTQTNTCTQGGKCQSIQFVPNKFCTCSQPADCPSNKLCRIVGQGIGFCAPDDSKGCQATGCPNGFKCVGTECLPENAEPRPEPAAEVAPEPTPEATAETTNEQSTTEPSAETTDDGGTADKGSGTDDVTGETTNPGNKSCGCQQSTPSEIPVSFAFLLLFLAMLQLRRR